MEMFLKFNKGLLRLPLPVRLWVMVLACANMIGPLFFLAHREAQIVLDVFLVSAAFMMILASWKGFTRLLGVGHLLWFSLLYFLWGRLSEVPSTDWFGIWLRAVMILNAISLLFDTVDVVRYFTGQREEMVPGVA